MAKRTRQIQLPGMDAEPPAIAASDTGATTASAPPETGQVTAADHTLGEATQSLDSTAGPSSLADRSVWVIDAHALIFQVFHAIPDMTSPQGQPVNAVYGFTRDVLFLLEQKKPDYLICAFDLSGPTFRHTLFSDYKIQRSEMPADLRPQIPLIRRVLETLGVLIIELESYEADDVLATVASKTEQFGGRCVLVTNDKDCRQLITERTQVYLVRKNAFYDAAALAADWGIRPDQVVDYQAMVGDPIDNVPGIPLIGPKAARDLLNQFDTLDAVLENADQVTGEKRRQNLTAGRQQALLSRELVRLAIDVPVEIDWRAAETARLDVGRLLPIFSELGFHSFADKARAAATKPIAEPWQADYRTVDTPEKFQSFLAELRAQNAISLDTETTDIGPTRAELVGLSFCWQAGVAWYLPVRAPEGEARLDLETTLAALRPVLEDPAVAKVGQNLKYDMIVLRGHGIRVAGVEFDTMVASYLLDAGERNHNLDELSKRYLDHETIKISELIGAGKNQKRMDEVSVALVAPYAAEDADVAWRLRPLLAPRLAELGLEPLFRDLELPLIDILVELESNGIRIDPARLHTLSEQYGQRIRQLEVDIYGLAGHEFNIASPKQLQQVLFTELRLPVIKKTKTGPSTDADVLETLAPQHPLPAKIVEYRQFAKLKGTYVDALPAMQNPRTGRVHASFNQVVAATGRLSSSDPNLQNIPIRHETGREIRSAFLPGQDGWRLLAADYSQIELRVLAHFSQDAALCEAFANDQDIHTLVASQVQGVPLDEVTREMRYSAKAVNFGVIYGQSAFGLAKQLAIEPEQAAEFIDAYFKRYPGVDRFMSEVLAECHARSYVTTMLGRRRAIQGVRSSVGRQLNMAERTAVNTVIQGSAADLIKLAMIAVQKRLTREGLASRMLLQIHDELVFEAPADEVATLAALVTEEMSGVSPLSVPLKVDVKSGATWADVEPWQS